MHITDMNACMHTYTLTYMHAYVFAQVLLTDKTRLHACTHITYLNARISHAYTHVYTFAQVLLTEKTRQSGLWWLITDSDRRDSPGNTAYIHTYIHTYMHT
jgi:hypothetical protein